MIKGYSFKGLLSKINIITSDVYMHNLRSILLYEKWRTCYLVERCIDRGLLSAFNDPGETRKRPPCPFILMVGPCCICGGAGSCALAVQMPLFPDICRVVVIPRRRRRRRWVKWGQDWVVGISRPSLDPGLQFLENMAALVAANPSVEL